MSGGARTHTAPAKAWSPRDIAIAADIWGRYITDVFGDDDVPRGRIYKAEQLIAAKLDRTISSVQARRVAAGPSFLLARHLGARGTVNGRVPLDTLAERDARRIASDERDLTGTLCGDPPKGFSALDRRR